MRVVYMGTPDIAATCLKQIIADGFDIVGVYTQPDRPKNRGMKLAFSAVKEVALEANLPVFQPEHFKDPETVEQLRALKPDVIAVVAYGRILHVTSRFSGNTSNLPCGFFISINKPFSSSPAQISVVANTPFL